MNRSSSRREFLQKIAIGLSAILATKLTACTGDSPNLPEVTLTKPTASIVDPTSTTKSLKTADNIPSTTSVPEKPKENPTLEATTDATTIPNTPDLVVVRNGTPEELVTRALAALGGIGTFIKQGANVVIKPNICNAYHSYEYASTTNPWVVGTLVKLCIGAGASKVLVLDYPFGGDSKQAYATSGIQEQVSASGGEMVSIARFKFKDTKFPDGVDLKGAAVFDDILNADVLINVPIAKHHGSARLTLGMKNLMGIVQDRQAIHFNLGQRIADISTLIKPQLTIVDAVRILVDNGPTGGNLNDVKTLNTLIASRDIVAADSYAASLFGMKPDDLDYIVSGARMGLGQSDLSQIRIEELTQ